MRQVGIWLALAASAWCQVAQEANQDYATTEDRAKMIERLESPARLANLRLASSFHVSRFLVVRPWWTWAPGQALCWKI